MSVEVVISRPNNGIRGAAFYRYTEPYHPGEQVQSDMQQDPEASRFIKIGICIQCFNAGPAGYECQRCKNIWFTGLRDPQGNDVSPIRIIEAVGRELFHVTGIELDASFSLAVPECDRWDNSLVTEWTAELQAQFEQMRIAHAQANVVQRAGRRRRPPAAAAAAAEPEEEERPARRRRENA